MASAIERIQPEGTMDQECGIKDEMARDGLPWLEQDEPRGLKGRDGVNAECVIDANATSRRQITSGPSPSEGVARSGVPRATGRNRSGQIASCS